MSNTPYIELDPDSKQPAYAQIKARVTELIGSGDLAVGVSLPSIRQLAGDLGLAVNTVARAYRELERDGLVRQRGRRGTTVCGLPKAATASNSAMAAVESAVTEARQRGLDAAQILSAVSNALAHPG